MREYMKNRILLIMAWALTMVTLVGCDDSTAGYTQVVQCASVSLEGDEYVILPLGGTYEEPGYAAKLGEKDITNEVKVKSELNTGMYGTYAITYRVTTSEGYVAEAKRYVVIADPTEPVGVYFVDAENSYRVPGSDKVSYKPGFKVVILPNGDGTYRVSDFLGGWYEYGSGYGSAYALSGNIAVAADGKIELIDSFLQGWRDSADEMIDGVCDIAAGTISWQIVYSDMDFYVKMTKN